MSHLSLRRPEVSILKTCNIESYMTLYHTLALLLLCLLAMLLPRSSSSSKVLDSSLRMLSNSGRALATCVVSTASRGLGLEFAKHHLERSDANNVIALCRQPSRQLEELQTTYKSRLTIIDNFHLDKQDTIVAAAEQIGKSCDSIDLLINSAGILGDNSPSKPGPERSINGIDRDWLVKTLDTNLIGHIMLTKELLPLIKKGQDSTVVNVSARVGSIDDNKLGGWYSYRMSKAALNMFTKTLSLELKRHKCCVVSIHPGTTDTDLSVPFQKNVNPDKLFTTSYSVCQMYTNVIDKVTVADTGKFYAYDGTEIPY